MKLGPRPYELVKCNLWYLEMGSPTRVKRFSVQTLKIVKESSINLDIFVLNF